MIDLFIFLLAQRIYFMGRATALGCACLLNRFSHCEKFLFCGLFLALDSSISPPHFTSRRRPAELTPINRGSNRGAFCSELKFNRLILVSYQNVRVVFGRNPASSIVRQRSHMLARLWRVAHEQPTWILKTKNKRQLQLIS